MANDTNFKLKLKTEVKHDYEIKELFKQELSLCLSNVSMRLNFPQYCVAYKTCTCTCNTEIKLLSDVKNKAIRCFSTYV